jgi:hypothetical protein
MIENAILRAMKRGHEVRFTWDNVTGLTVEARQDTQHHDARGAAWNQQVIAPAFLRGGADPRGMLAAAVDNTSYRLYTELENADGTDDTGRVARLQERRARIDERRARLYRSDPDRVRGQYRDGQ